MARISRFFQYTSIRLKIVVPLLFAGLVVSISGTTFIYHRITSGLKLELSKRAEDIVNHTIYAAETFNTTRQLERYISSLGAGEDIELIVVVSGTPPQVVASSRRDWIGRMLADLPDKEHIEDDLLQAINTRERHLDMNHDGNSLIDLTAPLFLGSHEQGGVSMHESAVMLHLDSAAAQQQAMSTARSLMTVLVAAVVLLCGVIYRVATRTVLLPAQAIAEAIAEHRQGNREAQALVYSTDEIGAVAAAYNSLVHQLNETENERVTQEQELRKYIEEVEFHRARIEQQTVELTEYAEQLRIAKEVAEEAARTKSRFLANMSHEIRTPLTSIIGFGETLFDSELTANEKRMAVESIVRNGKHLQRIISDILDLSKIEAGKMDLEIIDTPLAEMIADINAVCRSLAEAKGILFAVNVQFPVPRLILTDPTRLKQIIFNLTSNAIKFTPDSGSVTVTVSYRQSAGVLSFAVKDSGIGIDAGQQEKLFRAFSQADASTTRKFGGTGLGLTIARELARKLGGDITLASAVGEGSTFTAEVQIGEIEADDLVESFASKIPADKLSAKNDPAAKQNIPAHILLVEDGPDNQEFISFILRKAGYSFEIQENGKLGAEAALAKPFDLVLMDMQMPVMDGYTSAQYLRSQGYTRPIIALTANIMKADVSRALEAGCSDCLGKPFKRNEFLEMINKWLTTHHP